MNLFKQTEAGPFPFRTSCFITAILAAFAAPLAATGCGGGGGGGGSSSSQLRLTERFIPEGRSSCKMEIRIPASVAGEDMTASFVLNAPDPDSPFPEGSVKEAKVKAEEGSTYMQEGSGTWSMGICQGNIINQMKITAQNANGDVCELYPVTVTFRQPGKTGDDGILESLEGDVKGGYIIVRSKDLELPATSLSGCIVEVVFQK